MSHLSVQTWRCRVAVLLDDPVAEAVLRRDGLTRDSVFAQMEPIAHWLQGAAPVPACDRRDAA